MLIEYRVANYRSIKEGQILSMVAVPDTTHQDTHCVETGISAVPRLLKTVALYGPNASGKSNIISSLEWMRLFVITPLLEGQPIKIVPFKLDPEMINKPSEFEVIFIDNGIRYQYGFLLNQTRILKEWLYVSVTHKPQCWFERTYNEVNQRDDWHFGSHLSGGKMRSLWAESTRANTLFLSTAVNLNCEQLRAVFNWFSKKLVVLNGSAQLFPNFTIDCVQNEVLKPQIIEFLQAADLGITDIKIKIQKAQQLELRLEGNKTALTGQPVEIPMAMLSHQDINKSNVEFELAEESLGTQRLFGYAGPFLDVLRGEKVLVVDELDSSLHAKMVRFLVELVQNNKLNLHGAQLIFTTHNTSLIDLDLFRRDQIWFVEKDKEQASQLYPLTDFSPRKGEALEKGYLQGRYGALPIFSDLEI